MTEYKVWAFARSAAPNLPALEEQLADVMREADRRGYIIVNSCMEQKYGTEFWRPALFAMLTAVQQGRVNAIMVQSLDRLSHDITTLYRILRFLQNHGAVLITTKTNSSLTKRPRYQTKTDRQTVEFEPLFAAFFVGYRDSYLRALLVCLCYPIKRRYGKK